MLLTPPDGPVCATASTISRSDLRRNRVNAVHRHDAGAVKSQQEHLERRVCTARDGTAWRFGRLSLLVAVRSAVPQPVGELPWSPHRRIREPGVDEVAIAADDRVDVLAACEGDEVVVLGVSCDRRLLDGAVVHERSHHEVRRAAAAADERRDEDAWIDDGGASASLAGLPWQGRGSPVRVRQRAHDLRHSFVALFIAEGHNVVEVARQAGHAPKMALDTYAHIF
jgi:hypothetical protein